MKIAVFNKHFTKDSIVLTNDILLFLKDKKINVLLNEELIQKLKSGSKYKSFSTFINKSNKPKFFISIGGDGTILDAVTKIGNSEIPIIGINTGRLGFFSTIAKQNYKLYLNDILEGNYTIDSRTLLNLKTANKLYGNLNFSLNEITVSRKDSTSMITINTFINGEYLNTYWADGLIVSTPTGSTGYSLSCGGPIIMPKSENFILTPVAPHNLNARPFVIPDNYNIKLQVEGRSKKFLVTLDSRIQTFDASLELMISKENFKVQLVKTMNQKYSHTLRDKLLWGVDKRN